MSFGKLAYQAVIPAFVALPMCWFGLNQVRASLYTGKEPGTAFSLVITAQTYIERSMLALAPFVIGVSIHWVVRRFKTRSR